MFILMLQKSRFLVAATEQGVVLGRLLAADTHLTRLQRLQGREGDTKALCSHGRSSRLQVLVPTGIKYTYAISTCVQIMTCSSKGSAKH